MTVRWTAEQAAAITASGDALLSAAAGTGKTTTVVGKILWSLGLPVGRDRDTGARIPPSPNPCRLDQIAAITFTEKAAHDLQTKLRRALEDAEGGADLRWELDRATVGTIHGFAADLLREHALRLDIDPTFRILDPRESEVEQAEVVRAVLATALAEKDPGAIELTKRYGLAGWKMWPGAIDRVRGVMRDLRWRARQFDAWTLEVQDSRYTRRLDRAGLRERARFAGSWSDADDDRLRDELALDLSDALYRLGRASVHGWLTWLERENARDFDSLILDARRLLTRPETRAARDAIRSRYRVFIIDEFQDTDRAQWEIAAALADLDGPDGIGTARADLDGPDGIGTARADLDGPDGIGAPPRRPVERPKLMLVGDPKQSIYGFRGADIGVWNEAREAIGPGGRVLDLSWNFRCEPRLVEFVNRVGEAALEETAAELEGREPASVVRYQPLRPARPATRAAGLEWLAVEETRNAERWAEEARRVAGRLQEIIGRTVVVDPDNGEARPCRPSDIAILARRNDELQPLEAGLRACGIPFFNSATGGLSDQQEVLDLVTALRVLENPFDDLRAFAYLRSPFVGLRDEVLARIALWPDSSGGDVSSARPLLERAAGFAHAVDAGDEPWFDGTEGPAVGEVERVALATGLDAISDAGRLADRADHAELLEMLLDRTGYRLHLLLRDAASERLANIERFLALLQEYRQLTLTRFLALWDRWGETDLGIPQARLFSSADDVITLSTIHAAKGLEWPVVVLVGTAARVSSAGLLVGATWTDPVLGPVFLPRQAERGPRTEDALARRLARENAEAARLLYVAATRARDRLLIVGPTEPRPLSYASWLAIELPDAREAHETSEATSTAESDETRAGRGGAGRAVAADAVTGTGGQMEAFADPPRPQLDLFGSTSGRPAAAAEGHRPMVIRRGHQAAVQTSISPPPVSLEWLHGVVPARWPRGIGDVPEPERRSVSSATERMLRSSDRDAWLRRYAHGVLATEELLPAGDAGEPLSPGARGTLIHGVLERIAAADELGRILDETIASLDLQELELELAPGSRYREALEAEIEAVVRSPEWRWYVEGPHYRELEFLCRSAEGWVLGAFDLYRPPSDAAGGQPSLFDAAGDGPSPARWVIDFKTHRIRPEEASGVAEKYRIQVDVYREAARIGAESGAVPPRVALHFTHPNVAIEV